MLKMYFDTGIPKIHAPFTDSVQIPQDVTYMQNPQNKTIKQGFPGGAVVENLPANAGDTGSSPGLGGSHMPRSN